MVPELLSLTRIDGAIRVVALTRGFVSAVTVASPYATRSLPRVVLQARLLTPGLLP